MSNTTDILAALEAIVAEPSVDSVASTAASDLRAALGGVDVIVDMDMGYEPAHLGGGEAAMAATSGIGEPAGAAPDIADLIADIHHSSLEDGMTDLAELLDLLPVGARAADLASLIGAHAADDRPEGGAIESASITTAAGAVITILYDDGSAYLPNTV